MGNIGYWAFYDCLSLENVTINGRVKTISGEAFRNCSSFTAINIPGSVETIEGQAFRGCYNLARVNITDGVQKIFAEAFRECTKLDEITIPESVIKLEASEEYIADYFDYIKNQKKNLMENIGEFSPLYVFLMDQKLLPVADVDDL